MDERQVRPTKRTAIVSPAWAEFFEETGIPAAVSDGATVYVTGHTGEEEDSTFSSDPEQQIRRTFINIAQTLAEAGTDWSEVVEISSFHVGLRRQAAALDRVTREFLAEPFPAWTAVGVTELWYEESVVEMSCIAVRGGPRS
ncbi:Rid family hydrolase [Humibacter soli]